MGASKADKELYFQKLKDLLQKYRTYTCLFFTVLDLNRDFFQLPSSS